MEPPDQDKIQSLENNLQSVKKLVLFTFAVQLMIFILISLPYLILISGYYNKFSPQALDKTTKSNSHASSIKTNPKTNSKKKVCKLNSYNFFSGQPAIISEIKTNAGSLPHTEDLKFNSASYRCYGEKTDREAVLLTPITKNAWIKKLTNFCQIPCKGFDYVDKCAQYRTTEQCNSAPESENCSWYACQNVCLSVGTPSDWVCK